ncbi:hypothetical protein E4K72_10660 [Oxalobacteraceae bacterium OM1]|nr:hypothetical protein E4K72_10660 [Oxalobacteraceae bacterium OM1]
MLLGKLEGGRALVRLKEAQAAGNANVFRLADSRQFDGSATSFHADRARLEQLLPGLERDFAAWPTFGGVALHEYR